MRRRAFQIVVLLLLLLGGGAIVNVAVAWGLVAYGNEQSSVHRALTDIERRSYEMCGWQVGVIRTRSGIGFDWGVVPGRGNFFDPAAGSYAMELPDVGLQVQSGWPTRTAGFRFVALTPPHPDRTTPFRSGLNGKAFSSEWLRESALYDAVKSSQLLWPGFAINTIFYAAVLWMMFAMPSWLSRKRRLRRGLCPACAYPIGSSPVCTECGGALKQNAETQKAEIA